MIFKLLVVDKTGRITKRMEDIFTKFMKGYQIYRVEVPQEATALGRKEGIDVIIINGDDYPELSPKTLREYKERILPPPKLLLLLEPNRTNTDAFLEDEVHRVMDSSNFRMLQMRKVVYELIHDRFMEEYKRRKEEAEQKKSELDKLLDDVKDIREDLREKGEGG